jgi:hypothetical protein
MSLEDRRALDARIRSMAQRWGYTDNELKQALTMASVNPYHIGNSHGSPGMKGGPAAAQSHSKWN